MSRGFDPDSYPSEPLVSYQTYRQLFGWNPPPLVIRTVETHENDRLLNAAAEALKVEQRRLSAALRGKRATRAKKAKRAVAKKHRKVVNRRKNPIHQKTAKLIATRSLIVTEELSIENMPAGGQTRQEREGQSWA